MWLIYALGGGWGHLTRACALARAHPARILANSPHLDAVHGFDIVPVSTREAAVDAIRSSAPSCLIVDTFPRGLGGELAGVFESLDIPKVLVHRDLNPRYVESAHLRAFVAAHYDLVLVPGEGEGGAFGDLPIATTTAPWLIRSTFELPAPSTPFIYVCASGKPEEAEWYAATAARLRAIGIVTRDDRYWPAIELLPSAVAVVGGGGYNTVHECRALNVPLIARAWPRKYDRQSRRLERAGILRVETVDEAVTAATRIWQTHPGPRPVPDYPNGVDEAVAQIRKLN